jgi:glycine/D-amino acid oxidase-like deaminating enzyme
MNRYEVAIVGAGIMGASAALELARRGARVALIDQAALPNPQGASVDHSKIFRFAYPDAVYVEMAVEALDLWRNLEQESARRLLDNAGLLMIGNRDEGFETQTYATLCAAGLETEMLSGEEVAERYPQFNKAAIPFAAFDPSGGILYADKAVKASIDLARKFGALVFEHERVVTIEPNSGRTLIRSLSGKQWLADKVLVASGPWTRNLLPEIADKLTTTRQEVVYFEPGRQADSPTVPTGDGAVTTDRVTTDRVTTDRASAFSDAQSNFAIGHLPIFIEMDSGFYGFPIHHNGAIKIGNHHKGEVVDPYAFNNQVGDDFINRCREFFARMIPALATAQVRQSHICIYNNSPDDDFIIDYHPRFSSMLIATGFSGHGFKFGPLVGRLTAELLLDGKSRDVLERFRLARFQK